MSTPHLHKPITDLVFASRVYNFYHYRVTRNIGLYVCVSSMHLHRAVKSGGMFGHFFMSIWLQFLDPFLRPLLGILRSDILIEVEGA